MMGADDRQIAATPLVVPEIVSLPAEVDLSNALAIGAELIAAFMPGIAIVIADMSATEFCDVSGLRYLRVANDVAAESNAELRVVARAPAVLRAMETIGVDRVLRIYSSLAEALSNSPTSAPQQTEGQPAGSAAAKAGAPKLLAEM